LGERERALVEFTGSLDLYRSLGRKLEMGIAFNNLGRTYGELGRDAEAFAALDSAHTLFTRMDNGRQLARNLYHRGSLLLERGQAGKARQACAEGLRIARELGLDLQ
ncbi:MAG: tetratricopeptide repeat protein, partial [Flavobacteriales bacterium]|nr:tetratricopeptide repeat protein [Flavobacteriales bacterium]